MSVLFFWQGGGGGPTIINVIVNGSVATQRDIAEDIRRHFIRTANRDGTSGVL